MVLLNPLAADLTTVMATLPATLLAFDADTAARALMLIQAWVQAGLERSPALMVGLSALIVLPPLAILGAIARALRPSRNKIVMGRRLKTPSLMNTDEMDRHQTDDGQSGQGPASLSVLLPEPAASDDQASRLEPRVTQHVIKGGMVRIGRQDDNDICLPLATVHRYHALVHRTHAGHFEIVDLSGSHGNGLKVNGRSVMTCLLADGDLVDVGDVQIRFAAHAQPSASDLQVGSPQVC